MPHAVPHATNATGVSFVASAILRMASAKPRNNPPPTPSTGDPVESTNMDWLLPLAPWLAMDTWISSIASNIRPWSPNVCAVVRKRCTYIWMTSAMDALGS